MEQIINNFFTEHNLYVTLFGIISGIIGIILSFVFYYKARKVKRLKVEKKSFLVYSNFLAKVPRVKILYDLNEVKQLSITQIAIYNCGDLTIEDSDIVPLDPICIESIDESISILNIEVTQSNEHSNNFKLKKLNDNKFILLFDYIDKNEGILLNVVHTGATEKDIVVKGKLKGVGNILHINQIINLPIDSKLTDPYKTIELVENIKNKMWKFLILITIFFTYLTISKSYYFGILAIIFLALSIESYNRRSTAKKLLSD